ncbi:MAG: hypothetical protein RML12_04100 [Xanthomonadales bacterium]|nr:hypothetical protein [Xanthomonadales bacterium]
MGVLLADLGRRIYLDCDPAGEELPRACRLRGIGGTLPLAVLDTVGYHRLLGRDAEGRPVELRRLPGPPRGDRGSPRPSAGGE